MQEQASGMVDVVLDRWKQMTPRDKVACSGVAVACLAVLGAVLSVLEERPSFPLQNADAAELLALHAQIPASSARNNLRGLFNDRRAFFEGLKASCPDGKAVQDLSEWENHVEKTGDPKRPNRIVLDNDDTRLACPGGPVWTVEGSPEKGYSFETPRRFSFGNWVVSLPDDALVSSVEAPSPKGTPDLKQGE